MVPVFFGRSGDGAPEDFLAFSRAGEFAPREPLSFQAVFDVRRAQITQILASPRLLGHSLVEGVVSWGTRPAQLARQGQFGLESILGVIEAIALMRRTHHPLLVGAVHLPAPLLAQTHLFPDQIVPALQRHGLPPDALQIDLLDEDAFGAQPCRDAIRRFVALGLRLGVMESNSAAPLDADDSLFAPASIRIRCSTLDELLRAGVPPESLKSILDAPAPIIATGVQTKADLQTAFKCGMQFVQGPYLGPEFAIDEPGIEAEEAGRSGAKRIRAELMA